MSVVTVLVDGIALEELHILTQPVMVDAVHQGTIALLGPANQFSVPLECIVEALC